MALTVLIGGVRSGKSDIAADMAERSRLPVVFIATAEPRDDEMTNRIERHREQRPSSWKTVEAPIDLAEAITAAPDAALVVVDCLTLWVSNLMERFDDADIFRTATQAAGVATGRHAPVVAVTNEVGAGIVPDNALARRYRDLLGGVNKIWTAAAERALLVVAGRVLDLRQMEGSDG